MNYVKWISSMSMRLYFAPIVGTYKGIVAEYQRLNRLERGR